MWLECVVEEQLRTVVISRPNKNVQPPIQGGFLGKITKPTLATEEPLKLDHMVCEQSFVCLILKRNLQQHSSLREYRVLETDLTSLLPKHRKPSKNPNEKTQYIFRLKIEKPSLEMYKNESLKQFNQTGFASNSQVSQEKMWDKAATPRFRHLWPAFSSRSTFLQYISAKNYKNGVAEAQKGYKEPKLLIYRKI